MTLIKSISGIRGTIGGKPGEGLTPNDIVRFTGAFGTWIKRRHKRDVNMVVGRDARRSGPMVSSLVVTTLRSLGINVTDLGMATTPTVEVAVTGLSADGGIIITASHNPAQWNALKLLNERGEFLSASDGDEVLSLAEKEDMIFSSSGSEGTLINDNTWGERHIKQILELGFVDTLKIRKAGFKITVDGINSIGGEMVPALLDALGVKSVSRLNCTPDGNFAHNPEPLPENLKDISDLVVREKADLGLVVDPDVDRLAIICEDGSMFGEEYTLVAVSDYILGKSKGPTVSNLSSSAALKDITEKHGCSYFSSAVGEVNVVAEMKTRKAVIGGEGNGGVIYPALHYGRDALVGIALFLTHLAASGIKCTELRKRYPDYVIAKKRMNIDPGTDFERVLGELKKEFSGNRFDERDGLKIEFNPGWVQIRKSNTEPIIRIYAEGRTSEEAETLAGKVISIVKKQ